METLKRGSHMVLPIVVLIAFLALGYTVTKAALMSIISTLVVFVLDRRTLDALGRIIKGFSRGAREGIYSFAQEAASVLIGLGKTLDQGAKMAVTVAVACTCAGIIVGVITYSGFGLRFSSLISTFSGGYLLFALVLVAMTSIILGMGIPQPRITSLYPPWLFLPSMSWGSIPSRPTCLPCTSPAFP